MNDERLVNLARLMATYNFEIEQLPNNLKCAQCKLVLKNACHLPCFCRCCRVCIDDMMTRGNEFCPGGSKECGEAPLSRFQWDFLTNKGVSRLVVKCPHDGCMHKCQLANIEEHLRECQMKSEECPFREFGCTQDILAAEEMNEHLQNENRRHSEILISMIFNINGDIETLKQRDVASNKEIETLKQRHDACNREIETLKHDLVLKDEQIRSIMDQMMDQLQNENKSIKNDIKLIKEEKEDLADQGMILTEKIEREITDRLDNDEIDSARVIEHVDREIAAITVLIGSNKDELVIEMHSVRRNIGSINQDIQSIRDHICSLKRKAQSIQALLGLGLYDASFVWLIDDAVDKTGFYKECEYFTGEEHPYKYRLESYNQNIGTARAELWIALLIHPGQMTGSWHGHSYQVLSSLSQTGTHTRHAVGFPGSAKSRCHRIITLHALNHSSSPIPN